MRDLDGTDREILRLLLEDARRPYADIAERVDLSPPAVSDRVDRLRDLGIVRRFTLDIDRSRLREGVEVLIDLSVDPGHSADVRDGLADLAGVEHVFETADGRVLATATLPGGDVSAAIADAVDVTVLRDVEVHLLAEAEWRPDLGEATLGLECVECGNTVTGEGVTSTLDGERYEFCCPSCQVRFEEQYERLKEGAS